MFKYILILVAGLAIGYGYGYKDAKKYNKTIVQRLVERAGGKNRGAYDQNLDKKADAAMR